MKILGIESSCDETAVAVAREKGVEPNVGSLLSSDIFYNKAGDTLKWAEMGVLAAEMESYALYCNAARAGKKALCILTISASNNMFFFTTTLTLLLFTNITTSSKPLFLK